MTGYSWACPLCHRRQPAFAAHCPWCYSWDGKRRALYQAEVTASFAAVVQFDPRLLHEQAASVAAELEMAS